MKLICFSYAGGSANIYYNLKRYIRKDIELALVELPGRGTRIDENCVYNFEDLLEILMVDVRNILQDESEYMMFGYSMGALITYELIHRMKLKPNVVFFAAFPPPHIGIQDTYDVSKADDEEFMQHLFSEGGISMEFLSDKEIQEIYLPQIKADYYVLLSYGRKIIPEKVCDNAIIMFTKEDDKSNLIYQWNLYAERCKFCEFKGNHFFINRESDNIAFIINNESQKYK